MSCEFIIWDSGTCFSHFHLWVHSINVYQGTHARCGPGLISGAGRINWYLCFLTLRKSSSINSLGLVFGRVVSVSDFLHKSGYRHTDLRLHLTDSYFLFLLACSGRYWGHSPILSHIGAAPHRRPADSAFPTSVGIVPRHWSSLPHFLIQQPPIISFNNS
jgi:hypothetical protein